MNSNAPALALATVPYPVSTGLCQDCLMLTTARCLSCLGPLCDTCSRGRDCSDPACHECHRLRCTDFYCGKPTEVPA